MTTISTLALTNAPRLGVSQAQVALQQAQIELSSGKLADIGLGLGATTGQYISLGAQSSRLQAIQQTNGTTATKLTAITTALDSLRSSASTFFTSLTQAASGAGTPGTLLAAASSNLDNLTGELNTAVSGVSIFAGINSGVSPMTTYTATSPAKTAVDASFQAAFGTSQTSSSVSSISGTAMQSYLDGSFANLFSAGNYGTTWSSASNQVTSAQISSTETVNTSISANDPSFRQLAQAYTMIKEFGSSNFSSDAGQAVLSPATKLVSTALSGITSAEAGIGQSQSDVSDANDRMTTQVNYLSTQADTMVGVDASALSTKISGLNAQIQASYEITAQLQQLSLVNYLK